MNRRVIALGIALSCCANVLADYVADRRAAVKLADSGKVEEAMAAFVKMAEGPASDFQKSDALEQATLCANRLKQYDRAMELAEKIPLPPVSKTCRMRTLVEQRKWQEVVAAFKDEEIDRWPEDVACNAYFLRGGAYYALKDGQAAEKDLREAADLLTEDNAKGLAANALGDTYRHLLKDDARAIEAYRMAYKTRALYKQCQAAISVAGIFRRQGKPDEAAQELGRIDMGEVKLGYWRIAMLQAWGGVLTDQGRTEEAVARYKDALQVEGILPAQRDACEQALKALQGRGK